MPQFRSSGRAGSRAASTAPHSVGIAACVSALAVALAFGVLAYPSPAFPASVAEGQRLAQSFCARCHVTVANGPASWTDAPSFESIAQRPGVTEDWLAKIVLTPHEHMLANDYTQSQADSIALYILSLKSQ